jgi:hypothetical protein
MFVTIFDTDSLSRARHLYGQATPITTTHSFILGLSHFYYTSTGLCSFASPSGPYLVHPLPMLQALPPNLYQGYDTSLANAARSNTNLSTEVPCRDGNSGTGTRYLSGMGMWMIFYPWVGPVPDPNQDGYGTGIFFPHAGNLTGTRYFTTAIILGCE